MYECHLTYDNVNPSMEENLTGYAQREGWKTSWIINDPILGPGKRFFLSAHDADKKALYAKMVRAAMDKFLPEPVREKIEHIVHDTKTGITLSFAVTE